VSSSWQYYLIKIVSWLLCLLPYTCLLAIGKLMGRIYYHAAGRQRRRACQQAEECLGVSSAEAAEIIRRLFIKLGQTFLEVMYMPVLNRDTVGRFVSIENRHYLEEALAGGRGAIFLSAHVGNWEWMGAAIALAGLPLASIIKRQPNEQHTRVLNEYRQNAGIRIFNRGTTELVGVARALKQGCFVGFFADQDAGSKGLFIDFMGKMASTPLGPATFARRLKVPIIPIFIVRRPEGGHRILLQPSFTYEDTGDETADLYNLTVRMTRIIEDVIKQYPDEWLWFQKRWNTKPIAKEGGPV
jgi:Kdo2-lipid IVA lauroyltransferase/acyltransferase